MRRYIIRIDHLHYYYVETSADPDSRDRIPRQFRSQRENDCVS